MQKLTPNLINALRYVTNTGGNATIDNFDEDHEPIGPMLRRDLMPTYMVVGDNGKLRLTDTGAAATRAE